MGYKQVLRFTFVLEVSVSFQCSSLGVAGIVKMLKCNVAD